MNKYTLKNLNAIKSDLSNFIHNSSEFNQVIQAARILGRINWFHHDGRYSDEEIEELIFAKFEGQFKYHKLEESIDYLHIISEAWEVGGHTPFLVKIVEGLRECDATQEVFATRKVYPKFIKDILSSGSGFSSGNDLDYSWIPLLIKKGLSAKNIILYIHPDDILSSFVARILRRNGRKVLFLNHADHVFTYGISAADVVLEISAFGWDLTKSHRPAKAQSFIGIPVSKPHYSKKSVKNGSVLTVGSSYKYRPTNDAKFIKLIDEIARKTRLDIGLIGPTGAEPWWSSIKEKYSQRIKFYGHLPPADVEAHMKSASIYLDSYPMTGGTAFPQALLAGCLVYGVDDVSGGYSLADQLRYSSIDNMRVGIFDFINKKANYKVQDEVREKILKLFSQSAVVSRLVEACDGNLVAIEESMRTSIKSDYYVKGWVRRPTLDFDFPISNKTPILLRYKVMSAIYKLISNEVGIKKAIKAIIWIVFGKLIKPI